MSEFQSWVLVLTVLVLALVLASGINIAWNVGHVKGYSIMQVQAIQRGYALYCPTNGNFAWNGECEE